VLSLAVIRHLLNWWFLSYVEKYVAIPERTFPEAHDLAQSAHA
jgi:hypothetical protein